MVAKILSYIFGAIGAVAFVLMLFLVITTFTFISQASTTEGTVTKVQRAGRGFNAVIGFNTLNGRAVEFTTPGSTNPPEFQVGQRVRIYYNPDNPASSARPDSFYSLWFWQLFPGIFALIFGGLGLAFFSVYFFNQRKIKWLRRYGQTVTGQIDRIQLNTAVRNGRKSPYIAWVHWRNPENGRTYTFKSDNIWLDPLPFSPGAEVNVLIDPANIGRYHVDISSLPVRQS
jgi:hypothetical protein